MSVTRADIDAICAGFPGAVAAEPPELVSWKVGGRMFACFGDGADQGGVAVKCPDVETAAMLIEAGAASRARYFHRSWVWLDYGTVAPDALRHRLSVSYDTIRAKLPAAIRKTLPPRETG